MSNKLASPGPESGPAALTAPSSNSSPPKRPVRLKTSRAHRRNKKLAPYLLLLPVAVALGVGMGYPLVRQIIMSFQEYGLAQQFGEPPSWIGLDNYKALVTDSEIWVVVARSVVFCLVNAALTMVIGLAIASLMAKVNTAVRLTLQTVLLLSWAMPVVAALTVWQLLFDTRSGVVNWLLETLGLSQFAGHSWLIEPLSFFTVATFIVVWAAVPFVVFSVYAALIQVSDEMLEAAQLDGANAWERFRLITLPTIAPVVYVVSLLQIVWDLRVFTQIFYLQGAGGISSETHLLGTYIYNLGVGQSNFGMASTVAIFMLILTFVLTFGYVRQLAKEED